MLTIIPTGGLANRINTISSAIGFCRDNKIRLRVFWFKDWGMGADFHHILTLNHTIKNVEIIDAKWYHRLYDKPRLGNLWIPALWQRFVHDVRISEFKTTATLYSLTEALHSCQSIHLISCSLFYEWDGMFDSLKPIPDIQRQIDEQTATFTNKTVVGVHIRRSDNEKSITESPTHLFIKKMRQDTATHPSTVFYLASDSEQEKQQLQQIFSDKIITSSQKTERASEQGIINALLELYTLAATQKIYGSYNSTYSALAAKIGKIPLHVIRKI
ncbi:MAG: hypothetical protein LBM08_00595 [Dysgonamonadaceae bacterium]|jgi:hypothetical protein|nr:hypothetical protein [Dysgonamonadaceae bacterium]